MPDTSSPVVLRPHHLLCIRFFEDKGYSEEFTDNMYKTIEKLRAHDRVKISFSSDSLCAACPNLRGGICETEEKVRRFDNKTASLLRLENGKIYSYMSLQTKIESDIFAKSEFDGICSDCEWANICHK